MIFLELFKGWGILIFILLILGGLYLLTLIVNLIFVVSFSNMMRRDFRIGGGTRKGFGLIRIDCIRYVELDLSQEADLSCYLEKTASLNDQSLRNRMTDLFLQESDDGLWETMRIDLRPEDFFLFGSGFGDDVSDITPVVESRVEWIDGEPSIIKKCTLIPATSVKGAIAHRTAY